MKHIAVFVIIVLLQIVRIQAGVQWTGVNLAGPEFDGGSYWPKNADINYYASKGMNVIRVPFLWQRIQPTLGASFATSYAASLDSVVAYATGKGVWVVLDVHNYARYGSKQIGAGVTNAQFADLWTKLANRYKANSKVIFGLMNEPNNISSIIWRDAAQVAVTAIRATGATNYILLPGNGFSGAWSWFLGFYDKGAVNAQSNAQLMPSVTDSLNKMIYEVHQYFDSNKSGTSTTCLNAPVGNSTLADFTFWLRENKKRAFLGEFGVANNANCLQALKDAVKHMHDNSDVWLGWTYWAGGNSWGEYIFTIQPTQNYTVDRAQMAVLKPYLHGLSTAVSITIPAPSTQCINQTVYDDARRNGWQDWSWAGSRNFSDTTQKHSGLKSLSFVPQNYEAIALSLNDATLSTTLYQGVEFYINGAPNGGQSIRFGVRKNKTTYGSPSLVNVANYLATGTSIPKMWTKVYIPFSALGISTGDAIQQITIGSSTAAAQGKVYFDTIKLVCRNGAANSAARNNELEGGAPNDQSDAPTDQLVASSATIAQLSVFSVIFSIIYLM